MLKRDNKDRPDWIDFQQYVNKTNEKSNFITSPNQQSNLNNFTPSSYKLTLSPVTPDGPILNKPVEQKQFGP